MAVAALVGVALAVAGCGKSDLHRSSAAGSAPAHVASTPAHRAARAPRARVERVPLPLPLTAARAGAFARAVSLESADVPGSHAVADGRPSPAREREAASCGGAPEKALGGGRSPSYERGAGLNRESISSGVSVLSGVKAVQRDLEYAQSKAGVACYTKILGKTLGAEESGNVRLIGVHVAHLQLLLSQGREASGLRITARVAIKGTSVQVGLYVDALALPYGPTEITLYTTSFVQPVAPKTQQQLLEVLRGRALREKL